MRILTWLTLCLVWLVNSTQGTVVAVLDREISPRTIGSKGIIATLNEVGTHDIKVISEITPKNLQGVDVLIISHAYDFGRREVVRDFVRQGKGVLLTHDAAGSGRKIDGFSGESTFPEISTTATKSSGYMPSNSQVKIIRQHPITEGLPVNGFQHTYFDHAVLCPIVDHTVLIEDSESRDAFSQNRFRGTQVRWNSYFGGNAALIASPYGQGRVVLSGMILGINRNDKEEVLKGAERTLLLNIIDWLGQPPLAKSSKEIKPSESSKYNKWVRSRPPIYKDKAVSIETHMIASGIEQGGERWIRFQLPQSVSLGTSIPVVLPLLSGPIPRTVSILRDDATIEESVPVQIETLKDGEKQMVFIGTFPGREVTAVFSSDAESKPMGLKVTINASGSLAEITGPHFSLLVGCEGNEPTIQNVRIHDWDWHHTWDGLERNNLSAPILRLAESLWPFQADPPSIYHERGLPFPEVRNETSNTLKFPVRVCLQVGQGCLTVYRTGQIRMEEFAHSGRIATFMVDRYLSEEKEIPEMVSYDLPALRGTWLWALRDYRYAVGGTFHLLNKMGETGLAPGMERMVIRTGETLVLTTDIDHLTRYQTSLLPCVVKPTELSPASYKQEDKIGVPAIHPVAKVSLKRLWKMRGTDDFFDILPEPVEIYRDLLDRVVPVTKWSINADNQVEIGPAMEGPFGATFEDSAVVQTMNHLNSGQEDTAVWRRIYVRCREITGMGTIRIEVKGIDDKGKTVVVVPVEIHYGLNIPTGIFTYSPQWINQLDRCSPDQWPKLIRDIAMSGLDFVNHTIISEDQQGREGPVDIQNRFKRYGLWWLPNLMKCCPPLEEVKLNKDKLKKMYADSILRWKHEPNLIGWYLSDEMAWGEPENGVLPMGYQVTSHLYDLCKKYDKDHMAMNLVTVTSTSYETSTSHLKSDVYCWDPYGVGPDFVYNSVKKVDTLWREGKGQPIWCTLRSCGPTFYDCLDLWLDIRQQSLAAFRGNTDGVNYFMYSHWDSNLEQCAWYAVFPGSKGPIATPRWQAIGQIVRDLELLTTAEFLIEHSSEPTRKLLVPDFEKAKLAGQQGRFYQMRMLLDVIIKKAQKKNP
jgi:hypothetical protein